jgi:hypothetical protein
MKKGILTALALSTASMAAVPALAWDRDHHEERVVVRDNGWAPQIIVRRGHHGYWDERHHWREARFVERHGHHGYWDHHHHWHDWNG